MAYTKQNFVDGQVLTAAQLNHMEEGIANAAGVQGPKGEKGDKGDTGATGPKGETGPGFTDTAKSLIVDLFGSAAYGNAEMQSTLQSLCTEWGVTMPSLPDIPVTPDQPDTPAETAQLVYELAAPKTFVPANKEYIDTGIKLFESITDEEWTIMLDATNGADMTAGNGKYCVMHCMEETTPYPGISAAIQGNTANVNTKMLLSIYSNRQNLSHSSDGTAIAGVNIKVVICVKGSQARILCPTAGPWLVDGGDVLNGSITPDTGWVDIDGMTVTVPQTLLLGAYQTSDGTKGRFYDGTIHRCKVYKGICADSKIQAFLDE